MGAKRGKTRVTKSRLAFVVYMIGRVGAGARVFNQSDCGRAKPKGFWITFDT